jgi:hypothetical protein
VILQHPRRRPGALASPPAGLPSACLTTSEAAASSGSGSSPPARDLAHRRPYPHHVARCQARRRGHLD